MGIRPCGHCICADCAPCRPVQDTLPAHTDHQSFLAYIDPHWAEHFPENWVWRDHKLGLAEHVWEQIRSDRRFAFSFSTEGSKLERERNLDSAYASETQPTSPVSASKFDQFNLRGGQDLFPITVKVKTVTAKREPSPSPPPSPLPAEKKKIVLVNRSGPSSSSSSSSSSPTAQDPNPDTVLPSIEQPFDLPTRPTRDQILKEILALVGTLEDEGEIKIVEEIANMKPAKLRQRQVFKQLVPLVERIDGAGEIRIAYDSRLASCM
ncbi:hypothetical protein B0H63DRAFT_454281 [Podospora didyma]|uniref:Uncharacterized protein n=1 Tax=Podospora didyma TaxID=330526 RepID=A0AAE0K536_9PEZI|nr:hypothetical protein B0H63DRAFT_454281 [Podospora didyma]